MRRKLTFTMLICFLLMQMTQAFGWQQHHCESHDQHGTQGQSTEMQVATQHHSGANHPFEPLQNSSHYNSSQHNNSHNHACGSAGDDEILLMGDGKDASCCDTSCQCPEGACSGQMLALVAPQAVNWLTQDSFPIGTTGVPLSRIQLSIKPPISA